MRRALRAVALAESISFVVLLLLGSVLSRVSEVNLLPVLGPVHGVLFLALVVLVLAQRASLRWSWPFTAVMLTVGSPGAHFAVRATPSAHPQQTLR